MRLPIKISRNNPMLGNNWKASNPFPILLIITILKNKQSNYGKSLHYTKFMYQIPSSELLRVKIFSN